MFRFLFGALVGFGLVWMFSDSAPAGEEFGQTARDMGRGAQRAALGMTGSTTRTQTGPGTSTGRSEFKGRAEGGYHRETS